MSKEAFLISNRRSALKYIKSISKFEHERLLAKFADIDASEANKILADIAKSRALREAIMRTFESDGSVDVIITTNWMHIPAVEKYLTSKKELHFSGKYKFACNRCFAHCENLEKIIFEKGVYGIDEAVLVQQSNLKEIQFPSSLKYIADRAFCGCANLSSVIGLPPRARISPTAFRDTAWFESFTDNFVIINGQLLKYNGSAGELVIPEGVVEIGSFVFEKNMQLKKVTLPSTLRCIGVCAFSECENLQEVLFNDTLKEIWFDAFEGCTALTKLMLPDSLKLIGAQAFDKSTTVICKKKNRKTAKYLKKHCWNYEII